MSASGNISIGDSPPSKANPGDLWVNERGEIALFSGSQWVFVANAHKESDTSGSVGSILDYIDSDGNFKFPADTQEDVPRETVSENTYCSDEEARAKQSIFESLLKI